MKPNKIKYKPKNGNNTNECYYETLFKGRHFSFLNVKTRFGKKEVIARNNNQFFACKVLPLLVSDAGLTKIPNLNKFKLTNKEFNNILTKDNFCQEIKVPIFLVSRPISKFYDNKYSSLDIYEIPGGVINHDEEFDTGGVRELIEELGLNQEQIIAYTTLLEPSPFDSGSHVECTGIITVLIKGEINPVNWESIRGEKTQLIPLLELQKFIDSLRLDKQMIEGYLEVALRFLNL